MHNSWQIAPDGLTLAPGCVDVWLVGARLESDQFAEYSKTLCADELARARRFLHDGRRREYIVARGLLRRLLARLTGIAPAGFEFDYGKHGKPRLSGGVAGQDIAFNISHSHGAALVALTPGGRLGVDLEKVRPRTDWRALARRFFSAAEYHALDECPPRDRRRAFFACWVRKEALVKGIGDGIARNFSEFDVSVDPDETHSEPILRWPDEADAGWTITGLPTPEPYLAALALDRGDYRVRLWRPDDAAGSDGLRTE